MFVVVVFAAILAAIVIGIGMIAIGLKPKYPYPQPAGRRHLAYPSIHQHLLTLLNGDGKTAKRLLIQAKQRYPGKPERWYWEKVIFDLERDRQI